MPQVRTVAFGPLTMAGIAVRTTNADEMDPARGRIAGLWGRFLAEGVGGRIPGRRNPEVVLAVYSDYQTNASGPYSLSIGAEIEGATALPDGMVRRVIPAGRYAVVTAPAGPMPAVVIDAWRFIWSASTGQLGGERAFTVDFEVHDQRSRHPDHAQVDVYLSLR